MPHEYDLFSFDLIAHGIDAAGTNFRASSQLDCQTVFADDLSTLVADGILWDKIQAKTNATEVKDAQEFVKSVSGHLSQSLAKELLNLWDLLANGDVYPNENAQNKAMWSTLIVHWAFYSM